jgi:hypothetical protein
VWLQGDNTRNSNDSRHYGPVPLAMLRGRVCYRIFPLSEIGAVRAEPERCVVISAGATTPLPPPLDAAAAERLLGGAGAAATLVPWAAAARGEEGRAPAAARAGEKPFPR